MRDVIRNARGERLDYTYTPAGDRSVLAVVAHGVTSHKDRPWLIAICEGLREAGIPSLRFSYSGNGASEGRYEDSTIHKEVEDLGSVLDALPGRALAYVGHSMGGAVGVLRAAVDARLRALVSLAGMVHVQAFMERHFGSLQPDRDVMLGKEHCPLTSRFLEDARSIGSVVDAARRIDVPWLIVHGTADDIVPLQDSVDVWEATGGLPELVRLPDADHRFTGRQDELVAAVVPWLARQLRGPSR